MFLLLLLLLQHCGRIQIIYERIFEIPVNTAKRKKNKHFYTSSRSMFKKLYANIILGIRFKEKLKYSNTEKQLSCTHELMCRSSK